MANSEPWRCLVAICALGAASLSCGDAIKLVPRPDPVPPVAIIESDEESYATLHTATFTGSASHDPDNDAEDALTEFRWTLAQGPDGSAASVEPLQRDVVEIFVDIAGKYLLELVVVYRPMFNGLVRSDDGMDDCRSREYCRDRPGHGRFGAGPRFELWWCPRLR